MNDKLKYFFPKVLNRLAHEKNRIWEHLPVEKISLWGLGRVPSKDEFAKRLQEMLGTFTPEFFTDIKQQDKATIIRCADQTLNHDFDLLGSGLMHLDPIPWHSDFKSGYTWPKGVFYRKLPKNPAGTDLKMPRELSRCHQLLWLGEAYLITSDEKYAREVVSQIDNWIDENPLMYSVNWECAMDVAIRAANWMYALVFISMSQCFTDGFLSKVLKSLYQHGFFIVNNLEKTLRFNNNHYMSDIVGLLYLGQLFHDTSCGKKWLRFAQKEYRKEILIQIMPSGVDFERSVSYHRLISELLLYSSYMMRRCGWPAGKEIDERLLKMIDYIASYTKPNELSPLVADNDDGRFLPFLYRDFRRHNYLTDSDSLEIRIIMAGLTDAIPLTNKDLHSRCYEDAKIAILRKGHSYLFTSCCDRWKYDENTESYFGTHLHDDLLSFEYSIGKEDFVVDPGAFAYTSDIKMRNEFRSTAKHNTVIVDDEEQHSLSASSAFNLKYNCNAKPFSHSSTEEYEECAGEYTTINGKMTHRRHFELGENELVICDAIAKAGNGHRAKMSFHLASGVSVKQKENELNLTSGQTSLSFVVESNIPIIMSVVDDTVSPSFGVLKATKTVVLSFDFNESAEIVTKFVVDNEC